MKGGVVVIDGQLAIDLEQYRLVKVVGCEVRGMAVGAEMAGSNTIFKGNDKDVASVMRSIQDAIEAAPDPPPG